MTGGRNAAPKFSVVIATFRRPDVLAPTLDRLTPVVQQVPSELFEIIVADDSRDDRTEQMVRDRYPHVRYVRAPGRGPAANRNSGAAAATGEWLAFIDDDCRPIEGWLAALDRAETSRPLDVIEGAILASNKPDSPFWHHVENLTGDLYWTSNLAVRREIFDRLGRFDEDFTEAVCEDLEFSARIRRSGVPTQFCRAAAVEHRDIAVTWRYVVWRQLAQRWHVLYALKAGHAPPPTAPDWRALVFLIVNRTLNLIRITWRSFRHPDRTQLRTTMFNVTLSWIFFPISLPYLMYWDLRFRRMIRERSRPLRAAVREHSRP